MKKVQVGFDPLSMMFATEQKKTTEEPEKPKKKQPAPASPVKKVVSVPVKSAKKDKLAAIGGDLFGGRVRKPEIAPADSEEELLSSSVVWKTDLNRPGSVKSPASSQQAKKLAVAAEAKAKQLSFGALYDPASCQLPVVDTKLQELFRDDARLNWELKARICGEQLVMNLSGIHRIRYGKREEGSLIVTSYQVYFLPLRHSTKRLDATTIDKLPLAAIETFKGTQVSTGRSNNTRSRSTRAAQAPILFTLDLQGKSMLSLKFGFTQQATYEKVRQTLTSYAFPDQNQYLFAYAYNLPDSLTPLPEEIDGYKIYDPVADFKRMGLPNKDFQVNETENVDFKLSPTYPATFATLDKRMLSPYDLKQICNFRSRARIPVLTWKHPTGPQTIWRCSQPCSGMNKNRSLEDEDLLANIAKLNPLNQQLLIFDARPKINAVGNRVAGKGYENTDFYRTSSIRFMDIENIHVMRGSANKLRQACNGQGNSRRFLADVVSSSWISHCSFVLQATFEMVQAVDRDKTSIVTHCSDGWDRTAQMTALTQLCLDPHYRSTKGFITIVEKEFVSFGHKFHERLGHRNTTKSDECSPVFLQFLDCVYQLTIQFPRHFQFNSLFLATVARHIFSCRFGTFLYNNEQERERAKVREKTQSIWTYLLASPRAQAGKFSNPLYCPSGAGTGPNYSDFDFAEAKTKQQKRTSRRVGLKKHAGTVLYPCFSLKKMELWKDYWLQLEDTYEYRNHEGPNDVRKASKGLANNTGTVFPNGAAVTGFTSRDSYYVARIAALEAELVRVKQDAADALSAATNAAAKHVADPEANAVVPEQIEDTHDEAAPAEPETKTAIPAPEDESASFDESKAAAQAVEAEAEAEAVVVAPEGEEQDDGEEAGTDVEGQDVEDLLAMYADATLVE